MQVCGLVFMYVYIRTRGEVLIKSIPTKGKKKYFLTVKTLKTPKENENYSLNERNYCWRTKIYVRLQLCGPALVCVVMYMRIEDE